MSAIMISIQPKWVERILNGKKTIEIRKTMPKCELPCKVYIYCTKNEKQYFETIECSESLLMDSRGLGKVLAEFTLNKIEIIDRDLNDWLPKKRYDISDDILKDIQMREEELWQYGKGKNLYAWYIDNLIVYDKPKELNSFTKVLDCKYFADYNRMDSGAICPDCVDANRLRKPPQSWCYCVSKEEII